MLIVPAKYFDLNAKRNQSLKQNTDPNQRSEFPSVIGDIPEESEEKENEDDKEQTFFRRLLSVLTNYMYILVVLSISMLYFIITGIQNWVADYMKTQLKVNVHLVDLAFIIISVTSPVLGVIVGGNITTYLGGYTTKKSIKQTLLFATCSMLSSIPIPLWVEGQFWGFIVFLWLLMFFGGAILPSLTGIMLNTVKPRQQTVANSMAYLIFNCVGYLPAPVVYGLIA